MNNPSYAQPYSGHGGAPQAHPQFSNRQYAHPQPVAQAPGKGFAITAMSLGICSLVFSWIPFVGLFTALSAITGLVMGIISLVQIKKGQADGKKMAIAGVVTSAIAIIFAILATIFVMVSFSNISDSLGEGLDSSNDDLTWSSPAEGLNSQVIDLEENVAIV